MITRCLIVWLTVITIVRSQDRYPYQYPNRFMFPSSNPYGASYPSIPGSYGYGRPYPYPGTYPGTYPGAYPGTYPTTYPGSYPYAPTLYGTINVDRFGIPYVGVNPYFLND